MPFSVLKVSHIIQNQLLCFLNISSIQLHKERLQTTEIQSAIDALPLWHKDFYLFA